MNLTRRWQAQPKQDSLRRAFTVYILRVLLPSRALGVAVPKVANLLELRTMLVTRRFGPLPEWAAHRLSAGAGGQLDTWFDRGVDAANLAEVFGGH